MSLRSVAFTQELTPANLLEAFKSKRNGSDDWLAPNISAQWDNRICLPAPLLCLLDPKSWGFYTEMFEKWQIFTLLTTSQEHRWRPQIPSPVKGKRRNFLQWLRAGTARQRHTLLSGIWTTTTWKGWHVLTIPRAFETQEMKLDSQHSYHSCQHKYSVPAWIWNRETMLFPSHL